MNSESMTSEAEFSRLLDRLVCGDLDEMARERVMAWLEEEPSRWRVCGLAFLEAQAWSQALGEWPGVATERCVATLASPRTLPRRARLGFRTVLAAAALLATFCLGLTARELVVPWRDSSQRPIAGSSSSIAREQAATGGQIEALAKPEPIMAALDVQSGGNRGPAAPIRIPVVPVSADAVHDAGPAAEIPEYVRQQWERRGYKVSLERRFLFARLPDGRQIAVPVDRLNVNPTPVTIN